MATNYTTRDAVAKALRQRAGSILKELRKRAGLTQTEVAKAIGAAYYTFISQIEGGFVRVPVEATDAYAKALGVDTQRLSRLLLAYYDPVNYRNLFAQDPPTIIDVDQWFSGAATTPN